MATACRALKRAHVTLGAIAPGTRSGMRFAFPYNLARWDFSTRDGDVARFTKNTGFRFRSGKRSVAMTHPRVVMDSSSRGYIAALIANERIKTFTVSGAGAKVTDSAAVQQIARLELKLTKTGANYVNARLHLALLPGRSVDLDGDGQRDAGVTALPLEDVSFDADTRTGTIKLGGGLSILGPNGTSLTVADPEVVLGATPDASGLYGLVNGVRIKVGDSTPPISNSTSPTARSTSTASRPRSRARWRRCWAARSCRPARRCRRSTCPSRSGRTGILQRAPSVPRR